LLFNSYEFLFAFFPATLCAYWLAGRFGRRAQMLLLLVASWIFYAWWDVRFLSLLLASIAGNYLLGRCIAGAARDERRRTADILVATGVTLNLCVIGVFKYANFFVANLDALTGAHDVIANVVLPLGISFFTFEQISFLVDVRRGQTVPADPVNYALFVSFFPRLVAGPVLRYNEIVPQLQKDGRAASRSEDLMVGLTIFFIGLAKKVVLADGVAPYAGDVFKAAAAGDPISFFVAWGGVLAYTCQLYFDFSGYSDMAIGAARCFGIRLPMNFDSPYKAASIIDFWRRWHMTLSRFLKDYLYIGLGGNRHGKARRHLNLMLTMLLGGLWHGANWTFVLWGGLHGACLVINHGWIELARRSTGLERFRASWAGRAFGHALTFVAVVIGWAFFRSPTVGGALTLVGGMFGLHGAALPAGLAFAFAPVHGLLAALGVGFADISGAQMISTYAWVAVLLAIAFLAPNSQELMARFEPVLEMSRGVAGKAPRDGGRPRSRLAWSPTAGWAVATGALIFVGVAAITRHSEFLYWQF
jgi:D-alanyl-lipoteichoic acid acyltransferase DltB (MBOAT superfamily)